MKKLLFALLFVPFILFSQGLSTISKEDYNNIPSVKMDNSFGFVESTIPNSYSIERFVPPVISQYDSNACTGFSIFYYGLSTQYNSKLNITDPTDKYGHSFDPYFAYSITNENISDLEDKCDATSTMLAVLEVLKSQGAKKQFFNPHMECYSPSSLLISSVDKYSNPYKIESYNKISSPGSIKAVNQTKLLINNNKPVIFGMITTSSLKDVKLDGNYSPKTIELSHIEKTVSKWDQDLLSENEIQIFLNDHMPHALTIVGYNDSKYGGSFRVVNSWGKEWGDGGYFWLKYKDFKFLTIGAYTLNLSSDIKSDESTQFDFNSYKRVVFDNNSSYEGMISQGLPNGQGIYSYDSDEYGRINSIGNWKDGKRNGFFTIISSEDEIFIGNYKNDVYIEKNNSFGFVDVDDDLEAKKKEEAFKEYMKKYGGGKKLKISRTIIIKSFKKA